MDSNDFPKALRMGVKVPISNNPPDEIGGPIVDYVQPDKAIIRVCPLLLKEVTVQSEEGWSR
jgi:hypothetical protein